MVAPVTVVFDLDDTLILERDYVKSGFRAVAQYLEAKGRLKKERYFDLMWGMYLEGVRGDTFDRLLTATGLETIATAELVEVYRHHQPRLGFIHGMAYLLQELKDMSVQLALISDGPLVAQQNKVKALGLAQRFDLTVLTDTWGRPFWKPHTRAFRCVERSLPSRNYCYIADNPAKDFVAPQGLGWLSLRLRLAGQLHCEHAAPNEVAEFCSVEDLRSHLIVALAHQGL